MFYILSKFFFFFILLKNLKFLEISELSKDLSDDPSNKLKAGIDEFYK